MDRAVSRSGVFLRIERDSERPGSGQQQQNSRDDRDAGTVGTAWTVGTVGDGEGGWLKETSYQRRRATRGPLLLETRLLLLIRPGAARDIGDAM